MKKVSISPETYGKIEQMIKGSEFKSVDEYVEFALREITSEGKEAAQADAGGAEDEEKIKSRLRALGYLD
jgi:Arc/MetJ-type ribon-helix-helix transcriptional regulator